MKRLSFILILHPFSFCRLRRQKPHQPAPAPVDLKSTRQTKLAQEEVGLDHPHVLGRHPEAEIIEQRRANSAAFQRLADHHSVQVDDILVLVSVAGFRRQSPLLRQGRPGIDPVRR